MHQHKLNCHVAKKYDALADLVEQEYDANFRPWYGCLDVTCSFDESYELVGQTVHLAFEDGRVGSAYLWGGPSEEVHVAHDDQLPGSHCLLYFMGMTRLDLPATPHPDFPIQYR